MDIFCCCWTAKSKSEVGVVEKIVVSRLIMELLYCFLFFFCFSKTKSMANKLTNIRGQKGEFLFWKSREETRQ